jgi:hypothetical protein
MSACRSCGAPVIWVTMIETRKAMPLDAEPVPNGNIVVDWRHHAGAVLTAEELAGPDELGRRYRSHFASCPQASEWRK